MGFRKAPKVYKIIWEDGDLAGLEVRARSLSVGSMLTLVGSAGDLMAGKSTEETMDSVIVPFASSLIEWNLEDENGKPVPATLKGIKEQELGFVMKIIMKWMSAMADVDIPLPGGSNSGATSVAAPPGMAEASASLPR